MPEEVVIEIVRLFTENGIELIIDGGWGVDALLGEQTRPHEDLDLAVFHKDVPKIRELLVGLGYSVVSRDDSWECNFVYGNELGHLIDIHSCTFNENKENIFGVKYDWESLQGSGLIGGVEIRCIPPRWLVDFHTGYPLDDNDFHDVSLLCKKFNLPLPREYVSFIQPDK